VRIARIGESIFLHELCYTSGLAPIQIKETFWANGFKEGAPVYCEHDPDQVSQLRRLKMMALSARKGPGSVNAGIMMLNKNFKVFYTASSNNLDEEKRKYMWVVDQNTGKPTNTPIDQFDHLMNASRYGVYTHYFRQAA
jgi:phage terminase large subunit